MVTLVGGAPRTGKTMLSQQVAAQQRTNWISTDLLKDILRVKTTLVPHILHPEWSRNAAIYQINTRQFTPEGTFAAAEAHLPRLKDLGVDILWLMPIHPIGKTNRKGTLGSPYSVQDYYSVNPEFGTLEDLKHFVQQRTSAWVCTSSWIGSPTTPPGITRW
jgi:1,4-alpha-glucan branching enzyme